MNEITSKRFVDLMAKCAVSGAADDLYKEAADHALVKSSSPLMWALPAAGAAAGGALGYFGTEDEKRKKRNALYGVLTGGLTGLGGAIATTGFNIASNSADNMAATNTAADQAAATAANKSKNWYKQPDGKKTWLGSAADTIPGFSIFERGAFTPGEGVYGNYNPLNIPARVGFGGAGYALGALRDRAVVARRNDLADRRADFESANAIGPPKPPSGKKGQRPQPVRPTETTDMMRALLSRINNRVQTRPPAAANARQAISNWFSARLNYRPYTNAALDEIGGTRFQGWGNAWRTAVNMARNPASAQQTFRSYMDARRSAAENLRIARNVGEAARDNAIPTRRGALGDVVRATEEAMTNPRSASNRNRTPLQRPRENTIPITEERLREAINASAAARESSGARPPHAREGRFGPRKMTGGLVGLGLGNPNVVEWLANRLAALRGVVPTPNE
jgi:hypothetical protein